MRKLILASVLAVVGLACGGGGGGNSKLNGSWSDVAQGTTTTLDLKSDGTATFDITGTGTCSGTLTNTGLDWTSTSTTITLSGTPTCSGSIDCGGFTLDCSTASATSAEGTCSYTVTDTTLNVTCSNDAGSNTSTFTKG